MSGMEKYAVTVIKYTRVEYFLNGGFFVVERILIKYTARKFRDRIYARA